MELKIDEHKFQRGGTQYSFQLIDDGKVVAAGNGFATREYLERSIMMSRRRVMGLRPVRVNPKMMNESTYHVIERWNDQIYGREYL